MKNLITTFRLIILILIITLLSENSSAQWTQMSSGITGGVNISSLAASGANVFAGTLGEGVYISANNGANWSAVNSGLSSLSVYSLCVSGSKIFAGTLNGVFVSTNNGSSWAIANNGIEGVIYSFAVSGISVYAAGNGGVFLSISGNGDWTELVNGLPNLFSATSVAVTSTAVYAGENTTGFGGIYKSTNGGANWFAANSGLGTGSVHTLGVSGLNIFAGTSSGVYVSSNSGTNWAAMNSGLPGLLYINTFGSSGTNAFTGTNPLGGLYLTTNGGVNWLDKNLGFSGPMYVYSILVANNFIFAAKYHSVWRRSYAEIIGIKTLSSEVPDRFTLNQNYPNPFNPETKITYSIKNTEFVSLKIYNDLGMELETVVNASQNAGTYEVTFSGDNYPSGTYFYKLSAGDFREVRKMNLVK